MARVIANGVVEARIGVLPAAANLVPTRTELDAAEDVTEFLNTLDASTTSSDVETPNFKSKFVGSIPGTYSGTFSAEFYRDDEVGNDIAWDLLPRGAELAVYVMRFGDVPGAALEVWPIRVSNRAPVALGTNDTQRFTTAAAVFAEPNEDAVVPAAGP